MEAGDRRVRGASPFPSSLHDPQSALLSYVSAHDTE